jgi:glycosyltransferase involved in cell wall biosynthesis/peptidoglycan/xylan/chitin deacetylase (PgdA/CDA1 family)
MTSTRSIRRLASNRTLSPELSAAATRARPWASFSIIIPTYQRRDVLYASVHALAQLRYAGEVEIIIVVDGSTDDTASALRAIDLPFPMTVIEQPNGGAAEARNRGAALARNDIVLFLDDDMIADPDLLVEHARLHREGADAVIGDTPIHPESPEGFLPQSVSRWITSTRVQSPLSPFDIFSGQLSVRRAVFEQLGGFDVKLTHSGAFGNEDSDFGVRLLAGHEVRHNPAALSRQVYVVTPRQFMDRARRAAAADDRFMRKHPRLAGQLLERKGYSRPLTRLVYRPLGGIPGFPALISWLGLSIAELALKTPLRSSRTVARLFSGSRAVAYWSALRETGWLPLSQRPLILCYHAIEDQSDDPVLAPYGVPRGTFVAQLESLTGRGFNFISPGQLAAFLDSGAPLPSQAVLITFDDGYADLADLARHVLHPRGIEALVFVVTGSQTNDWDQPHGAQAKSLLNAEERRELETLGVEIGSHSRTHREMPLLTGSELAGEASGSLEDLRVEGLQPRFFAYPYGAVSSDAKDAVAQAGFLAAFGTRHRRVKPGDDRFALPRAIVLSSDRGWRFRMKTAAPSLWAWAERVRRAGDSAAKRVRR